ncbi:MAG: transketolase family protein [Deltaproteobacteria bacterium]|nr:transketolase family protein [Deltaproteobacteria bacterium]
MTTTTTTTKPVASREAFGNALEALGREFPHLVVLDADLSKSTMSMKFAKAYPARFLEMGIQEANMLGTAAGLALCGKIPFCCSFACFISGRFDQIKMSVAYSGAAVRIIGTHAGVGIGEDGYSQQGLEDLGLMRSLPGMLVLQPGDDVETEQMIRVLMTHRSPAYVRLTRQKLPRVHRDGYRFEPGKLDVLARHGTDALLLCTGGTVGPAVDAAARLAQGGGPRVTVGNVHTIKPIDADGIAALARECKRVITVEDHNVVGGMGSAVVEALAERHLVPVKRLGVQDVFGESGTPEELYRRHHLDAEGIADDVRDWLTRR